MMQKQLVCVLAVLASFAAAQAQTSLLAPETVAANVYNGHQWWDIRQEEIPSMQNMAALFANGLKSSPGAFAGMFTELVALVSALHFAHCAKLQYFAIDAIPCQDVWSWYEMHVMISGMFLCRATKCRLHGPSHT